MLPRIAFAVLLASALAACAPSTRIVQQWQDEAFSGGRFKRVLVLGITSDATLRRVFEDEFSAGLRARGVEAVPGYTLLPEDGPVERARIERATREAKADAAIVTRVLRVDRRVEVVPAGPPMQAGFFGWYGSAWGGPLWPGYAQPTAVFQFDQVYVESQLWDVRTDRAVWSAVSEIFAPSNPRQDSITYSRVILDALAVRKLI